MNRRRAEARKDKLKTRLEGREPEPAQELDPVEQMIAKARKMRVRGDLRGATVMLRRACNEDEHRARSWTLLGALLARMGQDGEALRAFKQARWLRLRAGDKARAAVTERLAAHLLPEAA